jgi:MFS family permease
VGPRVIPPAGAYLQKMGPGALQQVQSCAVLCCAVLCCAELSCAVLGAYPRLTTLLQHAVLAARTIVTARTSDAARATSLGYVGAAYGVGFAIGPALGGLLSSRSLQATAWVSGAVSAVGTLALAALLPPGEITCLQQQQQQQLVFGAAAGGHA